MYKPKNTKGYAQSRGGRNAFCGKRGYKKKFEETTLETAPEGDQPNKIEEAKPGEVPTTEHETNPEKETEK
jgi:hypothetical protein